MGRGLISKWQGERQIQVYGDLPLALTLDACAATDADADADAAARSVHPKLRRMLFP